QEARRAGFPASWRFKCGDAGWDGEQGHLREIQPLCKRIEKMSLETVKQVWKILQRAHRVGVVHCDVRRPNVAAREGEVILFDWSSARYHAAGHLVDHDVREKHQLLFADRNAELGTSRHIGMITASKA